MANEARKMVVKLIQPSVPMTRPQSIDDQFGHAALFPELPRCDRLRFFSNFHKEFCSAHRNTKNNSLPASAPWLYRPTDLLSSFSVTKLAIQFTNTSSQNMTDMYFMTVNNPRHLRSIDEFTAKQTQCEQCEE